MEKIAKALKRWRYFPEPVQFIYVLAYSITIVPKDKIYIDKVCHLNLDQYLEDRNLTTSVCDIMAKNETFKDIEEETQRQVSELKVYEGLILNLPSILFSLVAGSLADRMGRTWVMAIPFIGTTLGSFWLMVTVIWWDTFPPEYLLLAGVEGLFGGYMCLNLGLYSYLADTSSEKDRTTRMSILTGIFSLGYVIGAQIGGRMSNYLFVFGLTGGLSILGFIYSFFILEESLDLSVKTKVAETSGVKQKSYLQIFLDSAFTLLKTRPGYTRMLSLLAFLEFQSFMLCINTQEYDYLMTRLKFNWGREDFSNYLTVQRVCRLSGLFLILPVISRCVKIRDHYVIFVSCIISLISYLILTVGSPDWGGSWPVYLAAALQLNSIATVSIRSLLSKLFPPDEIGKVFAVVGIGQAVVALLAHSLLGIIYHETLSYYPSMYLVPVNILLFISSVTSLISIFVINKTPSIENQNILS